MQTAKGQVPQKIDIVGSAVNKVSEVKQTMQQNKILQGYSNMMQYDGDLPKENK
jgi:hypothetical protein